MRSRTLGPEDPETRAALRNLASSLVWTKELADRMVGIWLPDAEGHRPVYGETPAFQEDPHWKDHLLFYEYFHGDNGAGIGASHQTGWTGTVARLIQLFGSADARDVLDGPEWPLAHHYDTDKAEEPA